MQYVIFPPKLQSTIFHDRESCSLWKFFWTANEKWPVFKGFEKLTTSATALIEFFNAQLIFLFRAMEISKALFVCQPRSFSVCAISMIKKTSGNSSLIWARAQYQTSPNFGKQYCQSWLLKQPETSFLCYISSERICFLAFEVLRSNRYWQNSNYGSLVMAYWYRPVHFSAPIFLSLHAIVWVPKKFFSSCVKYVISEAHQSVGGVMERFQTCFMNPLKLLWIIVFKLVHYSIQELVIKQAVLVHLSELEASWLEMIEKKWN